MKKLLPLLLILTSISCRQETEAELPLPVPERLQTASFSVRIDGEDTKSLVSPCVEDFVCAYLFAFWSDSKIICTQEEDGRSIPFAIYSEQKQFEWELPAGSGRPIDIWTLVNPADELRGTLNDYLQGKRPLSEDDLAQLNFVCNSPETLMALESKGTHMPMSGIEKGLLLSETDTVLSLTLKRLFSRYDIKINTRKFADDGWTVHAAGVIGSKSNTEAPYFYTGEGAGFRQRDENRLALVDYATFDDLEKMNRLGEDAKSEEYTTFYFLENCQGDIGPASTWSRVAQEIDEKALACCTRLEIAVIAEKEGYNTRHFRYRLFLGQDDMKENFDIIRNRYKRLTLVLDSPTDAFRWTADSPVALAPGEWTEIPFETTLEKDELVFECLKNNSVSDEIVLCKYRWSPSDDGLHKGYAVVEAKENSAEGTRVVLRGGDPGEDISDQMSVTITKEASFFKECTVLYESQYAAEWSCYDIGYYVKKYPGLVRATLTTYRNDGQQKDGSKYFESIVPSPESDHFGTDKTTLWRNHLFYDHKEGRLFVYGCPEPNVSHSLRLDISMGEDEDGEERTRSKRYALTPQWPLFRTQSFVRGASHVFRDYEVRLEMDSESFSSCEITGMLLDPNTGAPIYNRRFGWADVYDENSRTNFCFTGARWVGDNDAYVLNSAHFFEGLNMYENERSDSFDRCMDIERMPRDKGSAEFDRFELTMKDTDQAYDKDTYFSVYHSLFDAGNSFHPVLRYHEKPPKRIVFLQAEAGTSRYEDMSASSEEAGDDFYLMKGLQQTFFINYQGFSSQTEPRISIRRGTDGIDFNIDRYPLKYRMERIGTQMYRIDFEIERTPYDDDPDDTRHGYSPRTNRPADYLSYRIDISHNLADENDSIEAKVLLQRLGYSLSYDSYQEPASIEASNSTGGFLKMYMFNPFQFRFRVNWSAGATTFLRLQRNASSINNDTEDPDSRKTFYSSGSREVTPDHEGALVEGPDPAHTINRACDLAWSSKTNKYVFYSEILRNNHYYFYDHPIPKQLRLSIDIRMPDGFSSGIPGLSYAGVCDSNTVLDRYCTAHFGRANDLGLCYKYFQERDIWHDAVNIQPERVDPDQWIIHPSYLQCAPGDHLMYYFEYVFNVFSWEFEQCKAGLEINGSETFPNFDGTIGN